MSRSKKSSPKTTAKTPVKTPVVLVSQPHGGAIQRGGNFGNRGGGRPSNALREQLEAILTDGVGVVAEIVASDERSARDRLAALDFAARYSIGQKHELTVASPEVQMRVNATVECIADELPRMIRASESPEAATALLLEALGRVWGAEHQ